LFVSIVIIPVEDIVSYSSLTVVMRVDPSDLCNAVVPSLNVINNPSIV